MQAASHGPWAATRNATNFIPRNVGSVPRSSRSIHIPPGARPSNGTAYKLFAHSRNILGQFIAHLTAPGLGSVPKAPNFSRAFHGGVSNSIKQGMSFPARVALSRPLQQRFAPRGPNFASRSVAQVGLGTARNFSSSRPLFQNIVENVPIVGRAFVEADWDLKMREEQQNMHRKARKENSAKKSTSRVRATKKVMFEVDEIVCEVPTYEAEMAHYFPLAAVSNVTTYLLVPLAPTPTSKVPLAASPTLAHPLLPLPQLLGIHGEHTDHSIRVSSLFSCLDRAGVWEKGVTSSVYSHGSHIGRANSACTVVMVEFVGWSKAQVRGIIGESGTGWCVLEEVSSAAEMYDSDTDSLSPDTDPLLPDTDLLSGEFGYNDNVVASMGADPIDPSQSLILPTLDFSSSFVASSVSSTMSLSPTSSFDSEIFEAEDVWVTDFGSSGSDSLSSVSSESLSIVEPPSTNGFFGVVFSSDFIQRRGSIGEDGPREAVF